jgi:hypothetical protein
VLTTPTLLATIPVPRKTKQILRLTQCKKKFFVWFTKTERRNPVALSEKAKQFLFPFTRVSNTGTVNNMVGLGSPPVASTKQSPKNKADFQAKKKATKSTKTKASGETQPSTSTNAKKCLKVTESV